MSRDKLIVSARGVLFCAAMAGSAAQAAGLGVYTSDANGFDTHTYYYDDGREVTVIDTQFVPALTQAMVDQIRAETDSPVTRVVVTHPNPDKFNGLPLLHALGAVSIASEATAAAMAPVHAYKENFWVNVVGAFEAGQYPAFEPVKETFSGRHVIALASGETISLIELRHSGISSNQTVVRIDSTGDLIVGDLVHHKAHAWLEGGIIDGSPQPDLDAWRAALRELRDLGGTHVHGGRGEVATVDEAVDAQIRYLDAVEEEVLDYVRSAPGVVEELSDP
ncbi:MAG: MBL fold metallo-hydrolase, partial [Aquisalimonadaceae bacterium]